MTPRTRRAAGQRGGSKKKSPPAEVDHGDVDHGDVDPASTTTNKKAQIAPNDLDKIAGKLQPSFCAPKRYQHYQQTHTCFTVDELKALAESYNTALQRSTGEFFNVFASKKRSSIELGGLEAMPEAEKIAYLKQALAARLAAEEHQWVDILLDPARDRRIYAMVQRALRPKLPATWLQNSHQWLSTPDIERVMQQYEDAHPDFKFLGVSAIDFDFRPADGGGECVTDELCQLSVNRLRARGYTQFGTILNLDEHHKPGSHWVALYCCMDPKKQNYGLHYFDSVANDTPEEVTILINRAVQQLADLNGTSAKKIPTTANAVQLQFKNTECGIFAMYFLACCVSGKVHVEDVWKAMGSDDIIHALRVVFYRPAEGTS